MSASPLRHAVRRLAHAPLFSIVAVLTLAVGLGANTLIFSVVNGVLLKPLPFAIRTPGGVWHTAPGIGPGLMQQGPATYLTEREENRVFTDVGLWKDTSVSVTGLAEPERVQALLVTDGTLPLLGVQPQLGRVFTRADDSPGTTETVVLTHAYWQRAFSGDPSAVGRALVVDGRPREIIGVLPASFRFLNSRPAMLLPFRFNRAEVFIGNFSYQGLARLKPGVTLAQANADLARMLPLMMEKFPLPPGLRARWSRAPGSVRRCTRSASMSSATSGACCGCCSARSASCCSWPAPTSRTCCSCGPRGASRSWRSDGARRGSGRIAKELLAESLTLGLAGGALGVGLAYAGLRLLVAIGPGRLPRLDASPSTRSCSSRRSSCRSPRGWSSRDPRPEIRDAAAGHGAQGGRPRIQRRPRAPPRANVLVVAQVALALVLLWARAS